MHTLRLHDRGYKAVCRIVDKRDGHACIICGETNVQHHHVIFKSNGGSDTEDNLVCLCNLCHRIFGHGSEAIRWEKIFKKYLLHPKCVKFRKRHQLELEEIYRKFKR